MPWSNAETFGHCQSDRVAISSFIQKNGLTGRNSVAGHGAALVPERD